MRRLLAVLGVCVATAIGFTAPAFAGSPHFVSASVTNVTTSSITVSFKEAGLGNEPTVNITLTATAECINGGSNHPKAANKEGVGASGTFNVNNGQATGSLTATTTLSCSPPMTIAWTNVLVTDTSNNTSKSIPGTFSAG
jgi:hypothetical protein